MKVAILHGEVPSDAPKDELDVLVEVGCVTRALAELGYEPIPVPLSLDLEAARDMLLDIKPSLVFNLVESLSGSGELICTGPMLLDYLGIPYTGAGATAMFTTSNKLIAKRYLQTAGIPTPPWITGEALLRQPVTFPGPYIVKSVWEHGSVWLDETAIIEEEERLRPAIEGRLRHRRGHWFVEQYIEGREFNLSLLAGPRGPETFPPAEILFVDYPSERAKVLDYKAKWEEGTFEYDNTRRCYDFPPEDRTILEQLTRSARSCWALFDLRGYARVDFRIDSDGRPWVLEVNANPCLSPHSGFVIASARSGLKFSQVIDRIISDSLPVKRPTPRKAQRKRRRGQEKRPVLFETL